MRQLKFLSFFLLPILLSSCVGCRPTVNPNEWVLTTGTCWNTMTLSKAGDVFPRLLTPCDRAVVLPATTLSAEFVTETKFKNRVAGEVNIVYQWRIVDPVKFVQNAKSVISSPVNDSYKIDPEALEDIENSVVDKMLIDILREYTPSKEAGIDELTIERDLQALSEQRVGERGIAFSGMSVNVNFTPQIEEALDIISALQFYSDKGERELGEQVIKQKAGAANITTSK